MPTNQSVRKMTKTPRINLPKKKLSAAKKEKFKYYKLFTFKPKNIQNNVELSVATQTENDQEMTEFNSPDKTEILQNISCTQDDFKIDKK